MAKSTSSPNICSVHWAMNHRNIMIRLLKGFIVSFNFGLDFRSEISKGVDALPSGTKAFLKSGASHNLQHSYRS